MAAVESGPAGRGEAGVAREGGRRGKGVIRE